MMNPNSTSRSELLVRFLLPVLLVLWTGVTLMKELEGKTYKINDSKQHTTPRGPVEIRTDLTIVDSRTANEPNLEVGLMNLTFETRDSELQVADLCIMAVGITQNIGVVYHDVILMNFNIEQPVTHTFDNFCSFDGDQNRYLGEHDPYSTEFFSRNGSALYPFDEWTVSVDIWIDVRNKDGESVPAIPLLFLRPDIAGWDANIQLREKTISHPNDYSQQIPVTEMSIVLKRHLSTRILTTILFTSLLFIIGSIYFVKSSEGVLGITVGIILGLLSVQEVLAPPNLPITNLVQSLTLLLYVLLAAVVSIRIFFKPAYEQRRELQTQEQTHKENVDDEPNQSEQENHR